MNLSGSVPIEAARPALADSNSTRTEPSVGKWGDLEATVRLALPKAAEQIGFRQIIRPMWEVGPGLKILCSSTLAMTPRP